MSLKVTDGGSRRIRREVMKACEGAFYVFDYSSQEAVIMAPASNMPLLDWQSANLDICSVCRRPQFDKPSARGGVNHVHSLFRN